VGHHSHNHDHDDHIDPDGKVGDPSKSLQSPDLAERHAQNRPDHAADNITDIPVDLIEALTIANDDHTH
jgi:hypothetical protein